ncbi:hypothetical protein [Enterobacter ludwigii]
MSNVKDNFISLLKGKKEQTPLKKGVTVNNIKNGNLEGLYVKGNFHTGVEINGAEDFVLRNTTIIFEDEKQSLLALIEKLATTDNEKCQHLAQLLLDFHDENDDASKIKKYSDVIDFIRFHIDTLPQFALSAGSAIKAVMVSLGLMSD